METDYGLPSTQAGGVLIYPLMSFADAPQQVGAPQQNIMGKSSTTVRIGGSVITQITGVYQDGINKNYPGS